MIVELHGAGLHLLCSIDHLFRARKDLQVPPLRGLLLKMNGVLSLLHVYLHLQSGGELHQDTKEVLCSLLWEESGIVTLEGMLEQVCLIFLWCA